MKPVLHFTIFLFAVLSLSSCIKVVNTPPQAAGNPITGSWVLAGAMENDGYGWQSFSPGFETGIFDFYGNGAAQYTDSYSTLSGSWYTTISTAGYYDEYGVYYNDAHQTFQTQLSDTYGTGTLNLYFDYVNVIGPNSFVATYFDGKYIQRFTFNRY